MEHGCWVSDELLVQWNQRANIARPIGKIAEKIIVQVEDEFGDSNARSQTDREEAADTENEWDKLVETYEDLERKVHPCNLFNLI